MFWALRGLSHVLLVVALAAGGYCVNAMGVLERDVRALEKAVSGNDTELKVMQGNRFTAADGVALYKQFTEAVRSIEARTASMPDLAARMERLELKLDRLLENRGL